MHIMNISSIYSSPKIVTLILLITDRVYISSNLLFNLFPNIRNSTLMILYSVFISLLTSF